jgi:hypothetical protein
MPSNTSTVSRTMQKIGKGAGHMWCTNPSANDQKSATVGAGMSIAGAPGGVLV